MESVLKEYRIRQTRGKVILLLGTILLASGALMFLVDRCLYYRSQWFAAQQLVRPQGASLVEDRKELTSQTHPARLLLLGDSRVFRMPLPAEYGLELGSLSIINKGIPGGGVRSVADLFRVEGAKLEPSVMFIQIGINDVMNDPPDDAMTRFQQTLTDFRTSLASRETMVLLSTIIPLSRRHLLLHHQRLAYEPSAFREWNHTVHAINSWLRQYAATNAVEIVDLDAAFRTDDGGIREACYDADGIHLSPEGNRLIWQEISNALQHATGD